MRRSQERILTTHVGSLTRPPGVILGMAARERHLPHDEAALTEAVAHGVREVVRQQAEAGIDIVSDGEFSKPGFSAYLAERLTGVEAVPSDAPAAATYPELRRDFPGFMARYDELFRTMWLPPSVPPDSVTAPVPFRYVITERIGYDRSYVETDIANLRAALDGAGVEEAFVPAIGPSADSAIRDPHHFYRDEEELLYAMADALHEEYLAITQAGFLLQLDLGLASRTSASEDSRRSSERQIEAYNYALRGIPEERVRYHICWGSMNTPHTTDVPLVEILPLVLSIHAQAYSIEAANPRHEHEWMVWRDVKLPEGKILIPGIVSHQTNVVEHPELVAWRLQNFASVLGKENVIAGTDCGFSQNYNWLRVHPEIQWAKLEALSEGAALASKALW